MEYGPDKNVIVCPPNEVSMVSEPSFGSLPETLLRLRNCWVEDAEVEDVVLEVLA